MPLWALLQIEGKWFWNFWISQAANGRFYARDVKVVCLNSINV